MSGNIYNGTGYRGRRAGIVSASIDGEVVDVAGEAMWDATSVERETMKGQSGIPGFSEKPKAGAIEMAIYDHPNLSQAALMAKTAAVVVLVTANGKVVTGDGMWAVTVDPVNTEQGSFKVRFEGSSVVET